ncbi:MAG: tetrahydrofolate dehydrogenase/cyclohydrolase catalytic domain-containing protein [Pirellulaceae bacterium]|jgi:methylenetetrahydrofolate dehydrogenase (NADP+)/methenyltetrahydrofolate cyclohydrolase|nr:tetrahydrofolate dehydrogenase/cyclohydrolase catalytic domain-containing protein [Pirellulaceae bacterium]
MLGRPPADRLIEKLEREFADHSAQSGPVTMHTINCGGAAAATGYENAVRRTFGRVRVNLLHGTLPYDVDDQALIEEVDRLNEDASVHGVLIFEPLPPHINAELVKGRLLPSKDVDCVTPKRLGEFYSGKSPVAPATAAAVIQMLDHYETAIEGKRAVVVGRSGIVGKPAALLLMFRHATVTVCHTRTRSLPAELQRAEIIVAAAGVPGLITVDHVSEGVVVVDVATNYLNDRVVGDVDFDEVSQKAKAITPVPKGVGPLTTVMLAANLLNLVSSGG